MRNLNHIFENNRVWAQEFTAKDPNFFEKLATAQNPKYLWIGCSDSRVPANQIMGLPPGDVFVHRNVANVVVHTDFNSLSVIQFAVEVLKIEHIIVCGHYGCGGVQAAMGNNQLGLLDNWLRHIKDVYSKHDELLAQISDQTKRHRRLCELNVVEQVFNVCHTTIVQHAWGSGRALSVHGWVYDLTDGLLKDLNVCVTKPDEVNAIYHVATTQIK